MKVKTKDINSLKKQRQNFYRTYTKRKTRKRKKRVVLSAKRACIAMIIFVLGLIIFSYPIVSSYLAEKNQASVIQDYDNLINEHDEAYFEEEYQKAISYNESLAGALVRDPFVFNDGYTLSENYTSILDVNGVMGYVVIPKINSRLPIYHGISEEALAKGVGHIESTSLPVGGDSTHSVLIGHRGLPNAKLFTDLNLLKRGDHFYITFLNQTIAYKIVLIRTIKPEDLKDLIIEPGKDYITLVTCTPYGINTHRLIVRGERTEYIPEKIDQEAPHLIEKIRTNSYQIAGIIIGFVILFVGYIIFGFLRKKKNEKEKK